ncbi:unnamed protein product [Phyllotreta striolata]|uniref:Indole-3-acetaldehyde oxidase n=1 Tax=Phyllotreta striolata TaxID=444603 RepID=A0A9N9TMN2_PHYSR|nr:unnamed protein product [Phyllotreta striolata]
MQKREDIQFHVDHKQHVVKIGDISPETTLNTYLRKHSHLTGTKLMCGEGGCGVCTVVVDQILEGKKRTFSINSCLVSILSCNGWKVHTIEGIGNPLKGYHKIQKALSDNYGTQCGFCSPGMVMNMYALQESGKATAENIENSFGGNICRCTGYRPILHAFKQLATDQEDPIADIEDITPCKNKICKEKMEIFFVEFNDSKWYRVSTITDLLKILRITSDNYRLVFGNTGRGVFKNDPTPSVYIDILQVEELKTYSLKNKTLTIGGNVTLSELMELCNKLSSTPGFSYLDTIHSHVDLVATLQVRNIGSIAGNLMLKHRHNEFQSDIFLLLETFDADLVIVNYDESEEVVSPQDFLKLDMNKKVIKKIVLNSIDDSYKFASYKIMPRTQNAHAMVNAGFLVQLQNGIVQKARIVYGGIDSTFVHASLTEKIIKGKNLYDNANLQIIFNSLNNEIIPEDTPPDPTPDFRRNLAISLFYKFVLKTCPPNIIGSRFKTGGLLLGRPLSEGTQEYGTIKENWPLTQPIPKLESLAQASGQIKYIMDAPLLPNEAFVSFVTAKAKAGSTITSIDATKALNMEGVIAYFDKKDIPGINTFTPKDVGLFPVQEELFCSGTVLYFNQPVGIVVASDDVTASKAAQLVKISYQPPTKKVYFNVKDVVRDDVKDRIIHQTTVLPKSRGNDVYKTVSGEFYINWQYHYHMETQCCKVVPREDNIDIYPASQWMDINQLGASAVLGIPANKINIKVSRLGGGFGGKMYRCALISSAAALAAYKLQIPVTMSLSFEENMNIIGKRFPLYVNYEVEVNKAGIIQYLKADLYSDFGIGGNEPFNDLLVSSFENNYDISHWEFSTFVVQTDCHANAYTRSPGTLEGTSAIESIMEHIATVINLDAFDVKLANNSSTVPQIPKYWGELKSWADIEQRKSEIAQYNQDNRWMKRGLAVVPLKWILEVPGNFSVVVSIFHGDGSVAISHGGIEMGQGINTKVAQVCAYKFGIGLDQVSIKPNYSFVTPNNSVTGGSLTSEAISYAVIRACDTLLNRMQVVKEKMKNPTWVELVRKCFDSNVQLTASGFYWTDAPGIQEYPIYGICSTTVEVDILTGKYQISQVDIIEDLGESMSPLVDIGQIEGAFVMGIGYYMTEEIIFDNVGQLLTNRTWTYKPPGAKDIPINFRVKFAENSQNPVGVLRSKAVAEPPICLSVAVPLAVRNAINSARLEADGTTTIWVPFDGPTTVEKTFLNSLNQHQQYTLN